MDFVRSHHAVLLCARAQAMSSQRSQRRPTTYRWPRGPSEKGLLPGGRIDHRAGPGRVSLGWRAHGSSSLRAHGHCFSPWQPAHLRRHCQSGPVHAYCFGSHDGSIWVGIGGGVGGRFLALPYLSVLGCRRRAAWRGRDRQGSTGCDSVAARRGLFKFATTTAGRWLERAKGCYGAEAFSLYGSAGTSGSVLDPAFTRRRRMSSSSWTRVSRTSRA